MGVMATVLPNATYTKKRHLPRFFDHGGIKLHGVILVGYDGAHNQGHFPTALIYRDRRYLPDSRTPPMAQ